MAKLSKNAQNTRVVLWVVVAFLVLVGVSLIVLSQKIASTTNTTSSQANETSQISADNETNEIGAGMGSVRLPRCYSYEGQSGSTFDKRSKCSLDVVWCRPKDGNYQKFTQDLQQALSSTFGLKGMKCATYDNPKGYPTGTPNQYALCSGSGSCAGFKTFMEQFMKSHCDLSKCIMPNSSARTQ